MNEWKNLQRSNEICCQKFMRFFVASKEKTMNRRFKNEKTKRNEKTD